MRPRTERRLREHNERLNGQPYTEEEWRYLLGRYIQKQKARSILNKAIADGTVERKPCSMCGKQRAQGHHPDYRHPLLVIWFCQLHHAREHALLRRMTSDVREIYISTQIRCARKEMEENINHMQARKILGAFFGGHEEPEEQTAGIAAARRAME